MNIKAFTMAEVLITLGIIGIVVAMTFPTLISKHEKYVLKNQFQKAYAVIQNVTLMLQANGINPYEEYVGIKTERDETLIQKEIDDIIRFTAGSINCNKHYYICAFGVRYPEDRKRYKTLDGKNFAHIDADATPNSPIILADGTMIIVGGKIFEKARLYVDINGIKKGPNKLGYDLHTFKINKDNTITGEENAAKCTFSENANAASYLGFGCTAYAIMDINPDTKKSGYWNGFLK